MKKEKPVQIRSLFPFNNQSPWQNPFIGSGFNPGSLPDIPSWLLPGMGQFPFAGGGIGGQPTGVPGTPPASSSFWQQVGGLDGIITGMGKVQKILQMTQSMSPLMKMFTQSTKKSSPNRGRSRKSVR